MQYGNFAVGLICFLFAYLMYRYKAVWLLSGYITASKEERKKYDKEKLVKYTWSAMCIAGGILVLVGLLYLIWTYELLLFASWVLFALWIIAYLGFMNTSKRCYKDEYR